MRFEDVEELVSLQLHPELQERIQSASAVADSGLAYGLLDDAETEVTNNSLMEKCRILEQRILAYFDEHPNSIDTDDRLLEKSIGEVLRTHTDGKWVRLSREFGGVDGFGILVPSNQIVLPITMLTDLHTTRQKGTFDLYLIGLEG